MTSLASLRARIAEQQQLFLTQNGSAGQVFAYIPRDIANAQMPCWITNVGSASYQRGLFGLESFTESRDFLLQFFVANFAHGTEFEAEQSADAWFERIQDFWGRRDRMQLNGNDPLNGVIHSNLAGDEGIRSAEYPERSGVQYLVLVFRLRVIWEKPYDNL